MPRRCIGEHRIFAPIRPIALTLCDVAALATRNKALSAGLLAIAVLLLLASHLTATHLESHTLDLVYAAVKTYVSKKATGLVYQGVLHWFLANGAFFLFRFCAYLVLYVLYELGQHVVFALGILLTLVLLLGLTATLLLDQGAPIAASKEYFAAAAFLSAAFLGWYWFRYMSGRNASHKSFDFDVGAALVRLRSF